MSSPFPPGPPSGENHHEAAARPKFSRRPASFARNATVVPLGDDQPIDRPAPHPLPAIYVPAWQEDVRFGVVLLILIALLNVALVYGLPLLPIHHSSNNPSEVAGKAPTMPSAMGTRTDTVTLYSQPEQERRTIYLLDLRNTASEQNALSVSPADTPAPTARALDPEQEQ